MISYGNLAEATAFYTNAGFKEIEVPWVVGKKATDITRPPGARASKIKEGVLVASGEQGFIAMMLNKRLLPGRWICTTPCFRPDDGGDRYHFPYFMKVELIDTRDVTKISLEEITRLCLSFFDSKIPGCRVVQMDPPDPLLWKGTGRDIVSPNGIELGSYGIREHPLVGPWVYATGCAEPRLSTVVNDHA